MNELSHRVFECPALSTAAPSKYRLLRPSESSAHRYGCNACGAQRVSRAAQPPASRSEATALSSRSGASRSARQCRLPQRCQANGGLADSAARRTVSNVGCPAAIVDQCSSEGRRPKAVLPRPQSPSVRRAIATQSSERWANRRRGDLASAATQNHSAHRQRMTRAEFCSPGCQVSGLMPPSSHRSDLRPSKTSAQRQVHERPRKAERVKGDEVARRVSLDAARAPRQNGRRDGRFTHDSKGQVCSASVSGTRLY